MKCLKCGAELTEDTKFCSYCGAKVETEKRFNDTTEDVDFEGIHYDESISSQPGEDTTKKLKNKFFIDQGTAFCLHLLNSDGNSNII